MKQGRFPCGRMSSVQSGLELWATPTSSMCLQWCLQVPAFLGYLHLDAYILDASTSGVSWWLKSFDSLARNSGQLYEDGFQCLLKCV